MSSEFNYDIRLSGLNIDKDDFNQRASEVIQSEKANADESIFASRDSFIEHYKEEILNGKSIVNLEELSDKAVEKGYLQEDEVEIFKRLADADNGDGRLNTRELNSLLGAVYDGAQEYMTTASAATSVSETATTETASAAANTEEEAPVESENNTDNLYEKVRIQPWGTGVDDCLSRIIQRHVDGIVLYTNDYHQYLNEMCRLNGIEDPNLVFSEDVKLPVMKKDENGEILRDENGKILFYSEEELKNANQ